MPTRAVSLLRVLCAVVIAGCADSPGGPHLGDECSTDTWLGSFNGTMSGASAGSLAGCAYFTVERVDEEFFRFGMQLTSGEPRTATHRIGLFQLRRSARALAPSTYTVGPEGAAQLYGQVRISEGGRTFVLTGGSVSVVSSAAIMGGSLTLSATEIGGSATIAITGDFVAKCIDPSAGGRDDDFGESTTSSICGTSGAALRSSDALSGPDGMGPNPRSALAGRLR